MKKTLLAAIALTGAAVLGNANAANGDLYLGFEATGGTGATANLVFDLGSATSFNSLSGAIGDDLAATNYLGLLGRGRCRHFPSHRSHGRNMA